MENGDLPPQLDLGTLVGKSFVVTYTAHLPFPVGIPNDLAHLIYIDTPFKHADAVERFGEKPWVNMRVFDTTESGLALWQKGTHAAIEHFYHVTIDGDQDQRFGHEDFVEHNQWITLETPYSPIEGEDEIGDLAFTFHRCLRMFNLFLQAALVITRDVRIREITSVDLRPIVIIGALAEDEAWRMLPPMLMHPDVISHNVLSQEEKPFTEEQLNSVLAAILTGKPYMTTAVWRSRAQRALRQTGDATDAVISFQVAAESLLFDTYRMLLVDAGYSSTEIEEALGAEIPFKTLVTKRLPEKLGGQWDVTKRRNAGRELLEEFVPDA